MEKTRRTQLIGIFCSVFYIIGVPFLPAPAVPGFSIAFAAQGISYSSRPVSENTAAGNDAGKYQNIGAGFRYSSYGVPRMPENDYWVKTGKLISSKMKGFRPEAVWIVGEITSNTGVSLNFPYKSDNPLIESSQSDRNEEVFKKFDNQGFKIWVQVEPGDVDVIELIDIVLDRYGHHPCITGFGVDVEWYKISSNVEGKAVGNDEAREWVAAIRKYNTNYKLFLKHWLIHKMPSSERNGITFISDSQKFDSMREMVDDFTIWAKYFSPAKVGFQFGYPVDNKWWGKLADPFKTISQGILLRARNTSSVFWVDFSILDVFPPDHY